MFNGWLEAHEFYHIDYEECSMKLVELVALCQCCHWGIHTGRMGALFDKGVYDLETCYLVTNRKEQITSKLTPVQTSKDDQFYINTWDLWYLELEGKKYYSKFKDIKEWREFYATT